MQLARLDVEQVLAPIQATVSVSDPKAEEKKQEFLTKLSGIQSVTTPQEQELAVNICREAKAWLSEVEKARVALKKPFAAITKQIDKLAADHSDPIEKLIAAGMGKVSAFQEMERQRVAREEAARQEAVRQAHEAEEKARIAAEQAAALVVVPTPQADGQPTLPAVDDSALLEARALAAAAEEATQTAIAVIAQPVAEVARVSGMATRESAEYEITDASAVYKAHPEFFNLVEKKAVIRGVIHKDFQCPGMRVWMAVKSNVRL